VNNKSINKNDMIRVVLKDLFKYFLNWIDMWYKNENSFLTANNEFLELMYSLHKFNYLLWREEDKARRTDLDDSEIVYVKRNGDRLNQERNDVIEHVDEWLLSNLYGYLGENDLPIRTETPGSVFDKLSVLALKVYHMGEQTIRRDVDEAHIIACREKLRILLEQQRDLQMALIDLFNDLDKGIIRMKVYRQFKMYNDPNLNPQLYKSKKNRKSMEE
jgi:hypothetical protein